ARRQPQQARASVRVVDAPLDQASLLEFVHKLACARTVDPEARSKTVLIHVGLARPAIEIGENAELQRGEILSRESFDGRGGANLEETACQRRWAATHRHAAARKRPKRRGGRRFHRRLTWLWCDASSIHLGTSLEV